MLDHSSGSAQLSLLKLSQPDVDRYEAAIARLPSKVSAIARRLIEQHTDGTEFPTEIFELNEKQLGQLFKVFFGKLTSAAQATWQAIGCGTYLQKFATNSRHMLQRAIARSQSFTMLEVSQMLAHPVLKPLLSSLLVTDGNHIGLMKEGGKRLLTRDGSVSDLSPQASLRLIHPVDLIDQGGWISWRDWLREQQIWQPIPQVERGLFLPEYFTHAPDGPDRYSRLSNPEAARDFLPFFGHHIADSQFRAVLLGSGWESTDAGFFERELTGARGDARAEFTYQFFSVQIQAVSFRMPKKGTYETCYSRDVPLIDYSECVREVYLATLASSDSVDDPEASSENSAIRAHLSNRSLPNVRWEGRLLTIEGRLGTYVIDTLNRDMRMQTGQYIPFHAFADDPQQAFIAAIDQLATPESEERVLRKLKHLS